MFYMSEDCSLGTVFDKASGIRLPDLVESTKTILHASAMRKAFEGR